MENKFKTFQTEEGNQSQGGNFDKTIDTGRSYTLLVTKVEQEPKKKEFTVLNLRRKLMTGTPTPGR